MKNLLIIYCVLLSCFLQASAQDSIRNAIHNPSGSLYEYLANPVLLNKNDVLNWLKFAQNLWREIEKEEYDNNQNAIKLYNLLKMNHELYSSEDAWNVVGNIFLVRFDEGIQMNIREILIEEMKRAYFQLSEKFRQKMNMQSPQGFIFVWVFDSRQHMTSIFNLSREVGGLTYLCRFIYLPIEYSYINSFPFQDIDNFFTVFSHELSHAFMNSITGFEHLEKMPDWFSESAAIFLGGDKKVKYAGNTLRALSEEYSRYYDLFKFLGDEFSDERIYKFISDGIKFKNPDLYFSQLTGFEDYNSYLGENYIHYYFKLSVIGIVVLAVLIIIYLSIKGAGYKINPVGYSLFVLLIVLIAYLITGLVAINLQIKFLITMIIAILMVYSFIELKFYFKFNSLVQTIDNTESLVDLEKSIFYCLDKFRFTSQKKREKLYNALQKSIHKIFLLYKNKELNERSRNFFMSVRNYIDSSPNLKNSTMIQNIVERYSGIIDQDF